MEKNILTFASGCEGCQRFEMLLRHANGRTIDATVAKIKGALRLSEQENTLQSLTNELLSVKRELWAVKRKFHTANSEVKRLNKAISKASSVLRDTEK